MPLTAPTQLRKAARDPLARLLTPAGAAGLIFAHAVLALLLRTNTRVSLLHALLVLTLGLVAVVRGGRPEYAAYAAGYVAACEVLWRMTGGLPVYEYGKYAVVLILLVGMVRYRKAAQPLGAVQFLLLAPSAMVTLLYLPWSNARDALSFNLSGPLALCVSVLYLSSLRLSFQDLAKLLALMVGPPMGVATLTVFNLVVFSDEITFTNESNIYVTGFAPNQVSAMLGLGVVLAFMLVFTGRLRGMATVIMGAAMLVMATQGAMTFSRNGLYSAAIACLGATPFLFGDKQARSKILIGGPLVLLIAAAVVYPKLNEFTGGKLTERFTSTTTSHRSEIIEAELALWKQSPVIGVGPGMGRYLRNDAWGSAAHTEFSRLLAEHGLLGLAVILIYPVILYGKFRDAPTSLQRALLVCCMLWSFSFMASNAMRLAAPGFMFGLGCIQIGARSQPAALAARAARARIRPVMV